LNRGLSSYKQDLSSLDPVNFDTLLLRHFHGLTFAIFPPGDQSCLWPLVTFVEISAGVNAEKIVFFYQEKPVAVK
jgi:hypothetical protein